MIKEKALYSNYLSDYKCKYYITKSIKTFQNSIDGICSFGIKIDMLSHENSVKDSASVEHVGINENDVKQYIRYLYEGQALPCSLKAMTANNIG